MAEPRVRPTTTIARWMRPRHVLFILLLPACVGFGRREREGDVLTGVVAAAHGDDDVLPAPDPIGHGRATHRCRHPDRANLLARLLVIRAHHGAAWMVCSGGD